MTSMTVAKFGGSSVKDSGSMLRVSNIIDQNSEIKIVVISATQNTTNHLEAISRASLDQEDERVRLLDELKNRHLNIAKELYSSNETLEQIENLASEASDLSLKIKEQNKIDPQVMDQLYSIGERMSSLIMFDLCSLRLPEREVYFLDARDVLRTDSNFKKADPQVSDIKALSNEKIMPELKRTDKNVLFITQGFIGADKESRTTTLGREGSDYSAALFGEAIEASLVQIWTDVPGVASIDPRLTKNAKYMDHISYDEATALATLGAKVLFPSTLAPAKRKSIPVFVGSSIKPELKGTLVTNDKDQNFNLKAVTILKKDRLLSFVGANLLSNLNLQNKIEEALSSKISFKNLDDYSISFAVDESEDIDQLYLKAHDFLLAIN